MYVLSQELEKKKSLPIIQRHFGTLKCTLKDFFARWIIHLFSSVTGRAAFWKLKLLLL